MVHTGHVSPSTGLGHRIIDSMGMKTIGLCMIVKNEAPVIRRCLQSVRPLLDYVLVEDTGSTDGTQQMIRDFLTENALQGEVYDQPWTDFATNRSSALARLRERASIDYALIMDADDVLTFAEHFDVTAFKHELSADLYSFTIRLGSLTYQRPQFCSNRLPFRYRGVLHEFLECPVAHTVAEEPGLVILCDRDGSRSQAADKYKRDAELLEKALQYETDPLLVSRYTFYLAQSYRDHGELAKALHHYLERAEQGFWHEERFISLYEAAKIKSLLNHPASEVIGLFLEAYDLCPNRAESLHAAMHLCRTQGKYHQGYLLGQHAVTIQRPSAGLFLEDWIYQYGLFDEFAVLAYWSGHYMDCVKYAARLLEERCIPASHQERIAMNLDYANAKLREQTIP